jgi:hypothetical protein
MSQTDRALILKQAWTPSRPATSATKASPRTSKFLNWSKLAQAGDSKTTGSPARRHVLASRRMPTARKRAGNLVGCTSVPSVAANCGAASPIR